MLLNYFYDKNSQKSHEFFNFEDRLKITFDSLLLKDRAFRWYILFHYRFEIFKVQNLKNMWQKNDEKSISAMV